MLANLNRDILSLSTHPYSDVMDLCSGLIAECYGDRELLAEVDGAKTLSTADPILTFLFRLYPIFRYRCISFKRVIAKLRC